MYWYFAYIISFIFKNNLDDRYQTHFIGVEKNQSAGDSHASQQLPHCLQCQNTSSCSGCPASS